MAATDFSSVLRALKHRNYRLFFGGQIVSLIGTWLTTVATSWLVYRLARDSGADAGKAAFILGVVGFASQVPQLLLSPIAGVLVDRLNRHKVLVATQFLSMLQSFALAILVFSDHISISIIVALNMFQGFVNAFDLPARQSLTVDLVEDRHDLGNAIALSSSMVHMARLIGPAIAGFLIFKFGEGSCFLIDGFSYLAVMTALLMMRLRRQVTSGTPMPIWHSFREGISYAWNSIPIRTFLGFVATTSLLTMSQQVLLPVFTEKVLGGGERIYGFLLCASGAGALMGALYLASRRTIVGVGKIVTYMNYVLGFGFLALALATNFPIAAGCLLLTGSAMIIQIASINTIIQTIVDDSKRGRVMSLFAMSFMGMMPIGSLLAGSLAARVGLRWTFAASGIGCLLAAIAFTKKMPTIRKHVRPIYIRMGLLTAAVEGPH